MSGDAAEAAPFTEFPAPATAGRILMRRYAPRPCSYRMRPPTPRPRRRPYGRAFICHRHSLRRRADWLRLLEDCERGAKDGCGHVKARRLRRRFPWPGAAEKQKADIEKLARAVLDARAAHPDSSLADLYDPLAMPRNLLIPSCVKRILCKCRRVRSAGRIYSARNERAKGAGQRRGRGRAGPRQTTKLHSLNATWYQ